MSRSARILTLGENCYNCREKSAADVVTRELLMQAGIDPDNDLTLTYAASAETVMENVKNTDLIVLALFWVTDLLDEKQ